MEKQKILVVDDQPGIRLLLAEVFSQNGYDVYTAKTGSEALEKFRYLTIDLAILDYQLPIIDGLSVVKKLEAINDQVPLIFMSGLIERLTAEQQAYERIVKIVSKPFDVKELLTDVEMILT